MKRNLSFFVAAAFIVPLFLLSGCETTGGGNSTAIYYGDGFYDPWYYGDVHYDNDIVVSPPSGDRPRPSHPIASPPSAAPRPMPSIPSAPMAMPRGGGGRR